MIALILGVVLAAEPVAWQGRLLDVDGSPLEGEQSITLRLMDQASGGTQLWVEPYTAQLDDGYVSLLLGNNPSNPLGVNVSAADAVYLEVTVGGVVLGARQRVGGSLRGVSQDAFSGSATLYASIADAASDGLIGYLDMDVASGCEGATLPDRMGYLSATCTGTGIQVPGAIGMAIDRTTGVQHGALITFPNNDTYSTFTASFWWHPTSTATHASADGAGILWLSDQSGENMVGFMDHIGDNRLTWGHFPNAGNFESGLLHSLELQVRQDHWHHFVITRDATSNVSTLYVNGRVADVWPGKLLTLGPKAALANYHWLTDGNVNAHYGRGIMDDFSIWDRALTLEEVGMLHSRQRSGQQLTPL